MMNIMNPPADWSTLKKLIWLRGTPINGGEDLTVSGTPPLSLPNSLGKPLKAWEVALSPYQDLHGYDSPWPAGGGKNKCPLMPTTTVNEVTFTQRADGGYGLSGTANGNAVLDIGRGSWTLPAGTYYGSITGTSNVSSTIWKVVDGTASLLVTGDGSFTLTETTSMFFRLFIANGATASGIAYVQVETGSQASSFAPYSNICPIHGTDKLNLFVEESYDQSATPKAVLTLPQTVYTGTIGSEGGESRWDGVDLSTLTWTTTANRAISESLNGIVKQPTSTATVIGSYAEQYTEVPANGTLTNGTYAFLEQNNVVKLYFFYDGVNLPSGKLVFPLLTPQTFAVPSVTIPTPTGTATTWATAEDGMVDGMEVTYVGKA